MKINNNKHNSKLNLIDSFVLIGAFVNRLTQTFVESQPRIKPIETIDHSMVTTKLSNRSITDIHTTTTTQVNEDIQLMIEVSVESDDPKLQQLINLVKCPKNKLLIKCIKEINIYKINTQNIHLIRDLINHLPYINTITINYFHDCNIAEILNQNILHLHINNPQNTATLSFENFSNLKTISIGEPMQTAMMLVKSFPDLTLGDGLDQLQKIEFIYCPSERQASIKFNAPCQKLQTLTLGGGFVLSNPQNFFSFSNFQTNFPALETLICPNFSSDNPGDEPSIKLINGNIIDAKEIVTFVNNNKEKMIKIKNPLIKEYESILFLLTHLLTELKYQVSVG